MSRDAAPRSVALSGVQAAFDFIDVGTRKWDNEIEEHAWKAKRADVAATGTPIWMYVVAFAILVVMLVVVLLHLSGTSFGH